MNRTSPAAYDAIVIGAGIAGAAIAERMAARGMGRIAIIEKEKTYCTGSSARSAGGFRQQFDEECKIRAAMYAVARFETFEEEYGIDPGIKKHGYLILSANAASAAKLRAGVEMQNALGLDSRFLSRDGIREVVPPLETSDLHGASFSLQDGYLDPHALVQGFMQAFMRRGGVFLTERRVVGLLTDKGRVTGVETDRGPVSGDAVIVAGGPFAGRLLQSAGVELPLRPCRRQIFSTGPVPGVEPHWPMVLDPDNSFYFRPETGGVIMSLAEVEDMEPPARGNDIPVSRDNLLELARRATARCPILAEADVRSGWAGLRTLTPDERPVLGAVPGREGLFVAAGFSGYGITLSPFVAETVAAAVAGEPPLCGDVSAFAPGRFMPGFAGSSGA